MGAFLVKYAQRSPPGGSDTKDALIQKLNLLSQKLWVSWLMGCFRAVKGPLGAVHGGVFGPIRLRGIDHAVPLPFRGFHTKFELSFSKTLGFMA